ncbi:zn2-c6 fungal-type dna-binding domain [Trichoderma cornu-damae]|uniref:Zn2-c6 fungal-type dna-binding domain n=1 Tax=Trichoderma cornu-damae TaxID=654480 RepID=A0A9P8TTS8_9HYPO|nr:zn2-c6 fungal-type dna-binding domain [Trichoderma cornu-damae]
MPSTFAASSIVVGSTLCIKYGAECPGYRDHQELVFRNADPTIVRKRKKRPPPPPPPPPSSSLPSSSLSETDGPAAELVPSRDLVFTAAADLISATGANYNAPPALTRPVFEHWTAYSVPIMLNVYSNLDFIRNMYRNCRDDGPLIWAAHLFARTYVTNLRYPTAMYRDAHAETQRELGAYLGKTLSSVSDALKTPEGAQRDDVLATVWLLTNYELLVGSLSRTETLTNSSSRYNTECPPESEEWFDVVKQSLYPGDGLGLHISISITKICSVQARIYSLLRRRDFPSASREYPDLFARMKAAERGVEDWMESNPIRDRALETYTMSLYQSALVKGYHVMQLLINFLTHYPPCPTPLEQLRADRKYSVETARTAAQEILEGVPRVIGPLAAKEIQKSPQTLFDALRVIWPLIAVYVMGVCRADQRLAAEGLLSYIGRELGVRQALNRYPEGLAIPQEAKEPLGEQ